MKSVTSGSRALAAALPVFLLAMAAPGVVSAQGGTFTPGRRTLFSLDLAGTELGEFPKGIKLLSGNMTVVDKDGEHALRASDAAEFLITFKEPLPADFTLEFDVISKECCNPEDLGFEGTSAISQSATSMHVLWQPKGMMTVGGGETFEMNMPTELKELTQGQPSEVAASFDGMTFKLYTNGKELFTLNRKFPRGRVLRLFLGGHDDDKYAVYLTRVRVATNSPPPPGRSQF